MAEADRRPASSPPPVYTDAPPPERRSRTSMLILGVNVLLLAAAIWYVVWVSRNPRPADSGTNRAGVGAPPGATGEGSNGVRLGSIRPPVESFDPFADTGAIGRGAPDEEANLASAQPVLDPTTGQPILDSNTGKPLLAAGSGSGATPWRRAPRPAPAFSAEDRRKADETVAAIEKMGPGLEVTRTVSGAYPSSKGDAGDANRGIEALTEYLRSKGRLDGSGLRTADTDGDGRAELIDAWGNPFLYFSNDDYAAAQGVSGVRTGAKQDDREIAYAQQRPLERGGDASDDANWHAGSRYQLWSAGPNGVDDGGTYDDVASWYLR